MDKKCVLLAGAAMTAMLASPAMAQDARPAGGGIQDIIVTAEKVQADVQDVSQSISVITDEEIARTGASSMDQVLRNVPSLNIMGGFNNLYLRGVGSNQGPGEGGEPGVSVNIDGANAYTSNRTSTLATLVDIERIEVLRGPQGTLYGRNAVGGVVNVVTKDPKLGEFEGLLSAKIGNYDLQSYAGVINIPLGKTLAFRANATRETRDGYIHDGDGKPISGDADVLILRSKLLWQPSPDFSIVAKVNYSHDKSNSSMGVPNIYPAKPEELEGLPPFLAEQAGGHPDDPWRNTGQVPAAPGEAKTYIYQADVRWDTAFANLVFTPTYTKVTQVCNPAVTPICPPANSSQTTLEFHASNPAGSKIQWTVGAYYLSQKGSAAPTANGIDSLPTGIDFGSVRSGLDANGNNLVELEVAQQVLPTKNYALFGQFTVPFSDTFRAKAGLRWSKESKRNQFILYGVTAPVGGALPDSNFPPLCANCVVAFANDPVVEDTASKPWTYTVGFEYDAAPASMIYGMVSSGFKSGGIAPIVVPPQLYRPEKLTSFAIGSKNRFFNNTLQLNAEAFLYRYKNYQINIANEAPLTIQSGGLTFADPNEFRSIVYNAKVGTIKGFEIETVWQPSRRDRVTFNLAYNDGKYGSLVAPLGGPPFLPSQFTLSGGRMAFQPKWTLNGSVSHDFDLFGGTLTPRVDIRYSSAYLVTPESYLANFPVFIAGGHYDTEQNPYGKIDAYVNWVSGNGMFTVNVFARNLTKHAEIEFLNPGGVAVSPPRTYGIGTTVRF